MYIVSRRFWNVCFSKHGIFPKLEIVMLLSHNMTQFLLEIRRRQIKKLMQPWRRPALLSFGWYQKKYHIVNDWTSLWMHHRMWSLWRLQLLKRRNSMMLVGIGIAEIDWKYIHRTYYSMFIFETNLFMIRCTKHCIFLLGEKSDRFMTWQESMLYYRSVALFLFSYPIILLSCLKGFGTITGMCWNFHMYRIVYL